MSESMGDFWIRKFNHYKENGGSCPMCNYSKPTCSQPPDVKVIITKLRKQAGEMESPYYTMTPEEPDWDYVAKAFREIADELEQPPAPAAALQAEARLTNKMVSPILDDYMLGKFSTTRFVDYLNAALASAAPKPSRCSSVLDIDTPGAQIAERCEHPLWHLGQHQGGGLKWDDPKPPQKFDTYPIPLHDQKRLGLEYLRRSIELILEKYDCISPFEIATHNPDDYEKRRILDALIHIVEAT